MLTSLILILLVGFFAGQLVQRLKIPALVGMVVAGIALGPQGADVLAPSILDAADDLRAIAVMVILMKAGLGLDRDKLQQQGRVALSLGFLPALGEAMAIALMAMVFLNFNFLTGLLLGCILGAESPAVIVPGMLRLKSLGWGVKKGIPDAILTGSALSDVLLLLLFSLLLAMLTTTQGVTLGNWAIHPLVLLPLQVIVQVVLGVALGWLMAWVLVFLLVKQQWTENTVQDTVITASFALAAVVLAVHWPIFSGYLAVMGTGFFLIERDAPLARRLRGGFDGLWRVAEIVLFVLLGASIQLDVLGDALGVGVVILAVGTLGGRSLGWFLSTWGSNWTPKERLFLLPGNCAKATVQAAIGALPLALGVPGGETILALAALSILITAPLGAWAIPTFAPKLLERGEVDPTKVAVTRKITLLAAVDTSPHALKVLQTTAALARRSDGEAIVLYVPQLEDAAAVAQLRAWVQQNLADIRHRFLIIEGPIVETILTTAANYDVSEIILGKGSQAGWRGSVSEAVLTQSLQPAIVVDGG
ncbi:MAG: sodium:proton antiporter [Spirulina sp. DLM2.Bin59]|nr:MAG: sodium:proton antiporter [Spirulina sp. DLM2.Bin59]